MKSSEGQIYNYSGASEILKMQNGRKHGECGAFSWLVNTQSRIAALDQAGKNLNAVLEWNIEAESIAHALDHEHMKSGLRSPLHGIPVLLKDNIDTGDSMHTSAGSLALVERYALRDAFIVSRTGFVPQERLSAVRRI